jgi:hypothetical protein
VRIGVGVLTVVVPAHLDGITPIAKRRRIGVKKVARGDDQVRSHRIAGCDGPLAAAASAGRQPSVVDPRRFGSATRRGVSARRFFR